MLLYERDETGISIFLRHIFRDLFVDSEWAMYPSFDKIYGWY